MQVEEVQFNHDPDSASTDAMTIALNGHSGPVVAPEWTRWPVKRDPCAYALGALTGPVTIKVRFSHGPKNGVHTIRAIDGSPSPPQQGGCVGFLLWVLQAVLQALFGTVSEVLQQEVAFDAFGKSALTTFTVSSGYLGAKAFVTKRLTLWLWQYKSGGTWVDFDATGHTMYITADLPTAPWGQSGPSQLPWATALDRACLWALGRKTKDDIAAAITFRVNRVPNASYTPATMFGFDTYQLTSYLKALSSGPFKMNCTDCADAVTTLSNLLGCNLAEGQFFDVHTRPFLTLAGDPDVPADWVTFDWNYHEICWLNDFSSNTVWDGCLQLNVSDTEGVPSAYLPVKMPFNVPDPTDYKARLMASGTGTLNEFVRHRPVV
jgi:hypothetical protein